MGKQKLSKITLRRIKQLLERDLFKDRSDLLEKAVEALYRNQLAKDCINQPEVFSKKKTEKS